MSAAGGRRRRAAERRGRRVEAAAAILLMLKGYSILARRYRSPVGEIDLVARKGRLLAFVEVKARPSLEAATAALSVPATRRIERASDHYCAENPRYQDFDRRFDLIAAASWRLRHLRDAWRPARFGGGYS